MRSTKCKYTKVKRGRKAADESASDLDYAIAPYIARFFQKYIQSTEVVVL